jgi:hypothetical protein
MRTTLDIDDDVLAAAKDLASGQKSTAGRVISDLVRKALTQTPPIDDLPVRNGFPVLPHAGKVITVEFIEKLLEEDV